MELKQQIKLIVLSVCMALATIITVGGALGYTSPYSGGVTIGALYGTYNDVYVAPVFDQRYSYNYAPRLGGWTGISSHFVTGLRPGVYQPVPVANYPRYSGSFCQWPCRYGGFYGAQRSTGITDGRYGQYNYRTRGY